MGIKFGNLAPNQAFKILAGFKFGNGPNLTGQVRQVQKMLAELNLVIQASTAKLLNFNYLPIFPRIQYVNDLK